MVFNFMVCRYWLSIIIDIWFINISPISNLVLWNVEKQFIIILLHKSLIKDQSASKYFAQP